MHPKISKYLLYLPLQFLRGENVLGHLSELEKTQWLEPRIIKDMQDEKLVKLLTHAFNNVPYYSKLFKASGIEITGAENIRDVLRKIPILTKKLYSQNIKDLVSTSKNVKLDHRKTSGSSGTNLNILKSRDTYARMRAIMYRYYRWHGIDIGDKQARVLGHPTTFLSKFKEDIQDFILNKYRLDPVYLTEKNVLRYFNQLKKNKVKYLYGYPSAICEVGRIMIVNSLNPKELNIPIAITTGEILYNHQRKFIQESFGTKVANEYGCSELGIIAFECSEGRMHLSDDNLIIEVINESAEDGFSEILITDLFNYGVPLIRYKIGDLIKLEEAQTCSCGRGLSVVKEVKGRESEVITLDGGRKIHTEVFHYIFDAVTEKFGGVEEFRVFGNDSLVFNIQLVVNASFSKRTEEFIEEQFKKVLDQKCRITFEFVKSLEREKTGKLRYFIRKS